MEKENRVVLELSPALTHLIGYRFGHQLYHGEVAGKLNLEKTGYIRFPDHTVRVEPSFVRGFLRAAVDWDGKTAVKENLVIEGAESLVQAFSKDIRKEMLG